MLHRYQTVQIIMQLRFKIDTIAGKMIMTRQYNYAEILNE